MVGVVKLPTPALRSARPDICLVDLSLPDRDGLTLVHRLALEQGATVIIISGRAQVQDKVTGLELGADDYIIKPFSPDKLLLRLERIVARKTFFADYYRKKRQQDYAAALASLQAETDQDRRLADQAAEGEAAEVKVAVARAMDIALRPRSFATGTG